MLTYEEKLTNFINKNSDLIDHYNNLECSPIPLEDSISSIEEGMEVMQKANKFSNFDSLLRSAIHISIREDIPIEDAFDIMKEAPGDWIPENSIQQYFKEINHIYTKNNNDFDIEYCPENRDKLISMNLKTVISIAKGFQGLGLSLQDLISAGNLGLVISWDKYNPKRSTLHDDVYKVIEMLPDKFTRKELECVIEQFFTYGDVKNKFDYKFRNQSEFTKGEVLKWVDKNIQNAKFSSVASMWIRAYIMIELDNYSRLVKKPKADIKREKEETGSYKKEVTLDIDAPVKSDSDTTVGDLLVLEDESRSDLDINEAYYTFKDGLKLLLDGVKTRDRVIFLKKFGIGLPRPMTPREISDQEGLSIARISQILQETINKMKVNAQKFDVDPDILFDAVRKIN
jgi:RNA polymerase primary sigma factor